MDCMNPMLAVRSGDKYRFVGAVNNSSAQHRKYLFDTTGKFIVLPCGQCYACRIAKSREWAARCVLEAKMHDDNCFITLILEMLFSQRRFDELNGNLRRGIISGVKFHLCHLL